MVDWLRPIQERRQALISDPGKLDSILAKGTERARAVAKATLKEVKKAVFKS
jgi:tryptophanyl-tRNA synthetase